MMKKFIQQYKRISKIVSKRMKSYWSGIKIFFVLCFSGIGGLLGRVGVVFMTIVILFGSGLWKAAYGIGGILSRVATFFGITLWSVMRTGAAVSLLGVLIFGGMVYWYGPSLTQSLAQLSTAALRDVNNNVNNGDKQIIATLEARLTSTEQKLEELKGSLAVQGQSLVQKIEKHVQTTAAFKNVETWLQGTQKQLALIEQSLRTKDATNEKKVQVAVATLKQEMLQNIHSLEQKVSVNTEDKEANKKLYQRLVATEDQLKDLENKLVAQVGDLDKKVEQHVGDLRGATDTKVMSLEQKIEQLEKQETQEIKRLSAVNQIVKQEVSGQIDSLRGEVQKREQQSKRKKILERFMDQLAADDDEN